MRRWIVGAMLLLGLWPATATAASSAHCERFETIVAMTRFERATRQSLRRGAFAFADEHQLRQDQLASRPAVEAAAEAMASAKRAERRCAQQAGRRLSSLGVRAAGQAPASWRWSVLQDYFAIELLTAPGGALARQMRGVPTLFGAPQTESDRRARAALANGGARNVALTLAAACAAEGRGLQGYLSRLGFTEADIGRRLARDSGTDEASPAGRALVRAAMAFVERGCPA